MEGELSIVKVAKHTGLVCHIHGKVMVGAQPAVLLFFMAVFAFYTADKYCWSIGYNNVAPVFHHCRIVDRQGQDDDNRRNKADQFPGLYFIICLAHVFKKE